ncbi:hypothetical protein SBRCBS47491_006797 [Sporothrix bragantina]|uniref:RING-type domain-containing protein n=1 Tax=Sporothrix bragantina TaxID=671064 RepID=A0ABP0C8J1_9PEZI
MTDERLMPPRCCTMDAIAPKHAEKLFDPNFKQAWNYRYREVSVGRRVYCPSPRCGQWIKPENRYRGEDAREKAVCSRCHTEVCCLCNGKFHGSRECRHDERLARYLEGVRGGQNCYKCKSPVELEDGRNHIICHCGAESCMICGSKWGHCDCAIFDLDTDYPGPSHSQHPQASRFDRLGSAPSISARDYRPSNVGTGRPYSAGETMRTRPKSYEDKARTRPHRDEYRTDGYRADGYRDDDHDLARQMDAFGGLGEGDDAMDAQSAIRRERMDRFARRHANDDDMGMRARRRRSFMEENDDDDDDAGYHGRAATDIMPSVPQPPPAPPTPPQQQAQAQAQAQAQLNQRFQHQQLPPAHSQHPQHSHHPEPYSIHPQHMQQEQLVRQPPAPSQYHEPSYDRDPPTAPADFYTNGLSRTRAVHTDSLVGRLADRFNTDTRTSPMHRSTAPPALPGPPMPMGVAPGPGGMGGIPMGPLSPNGPMSLMPPPSMLPMQTAPAPMPPPPMMGGMSMMPMAPMMQEMPMMRRHGMEEDPFIGQQPLRRGRSSEQIPFPDIGHATHYEDLDEDVYASGGRTSSGRRHRRRDEGGARHGHEVRQSEMAGLAGLGRGMDRVHGWREFVSDEPPDQETASNLE